MKQKVFDYIEKLERKAKESEKYFKLWHEEKIKNNKAIEYIKEKARNNCWIDQYEANDLINILKGVDKD